MNEENILPIPQLADRPLDMKENVESLNSVPIDVAPEKAMNNIVNSKEFEVSPDDFAKSEAVYTVAMNERQLPKEVHPAYMQVMGKDKQHLSVARKDGFVWNTFANTLNSIERKKVQRNLNNLYFKKLNNQDLSDEDDFSLIDSQDQMKTLPEPESFGESVVPEVVAAGYDLVKGIMQGGEMIAKGTAIGAGTGAAVGVIGGLPGIVAGGIGGAARGLSISMFLNQLKDSYEQSAGGTYAELIGNAAPNEINPQAADEERKAISKGAGKIMAVLDTLPIGYIASKVPWIKKIISPKAAGKLLQSTAGNKFRELALSLGKSSLAEGFTEGTQEMVQIISDEVLKTWDGTETNFYAGMKRAVTRWESYQRAGKAAAIGAVAGPALEGGLHVAGTVVEPVGNAALKTVQKAVDKISPPKPKPTDIITPKRADAEVIIDAAETQGLFEQAAESVKNSEVNKNLPEESASIKQNMFDSVGLPHVYFDKEALNKFSNSEEKSIMVQEAIDKSNADAAIEVDAPIRLDSSEVSKIIENYPEFAELIKKKPEMGTAKEYIERFHEEEKKRAVLGNELPKADTKTQKQISNEPRIKDAEIFNEHDYIEQPTFTDAIEGVVSPQEVLKINEAQINARVEVSEALKAEDAAEYNDLVSLEQEAAIVAEREARSNDIESNPDMTFVESFLNNDILIGQLEENQLRRLDSGQPIFAVDPSTIPDDLRARFENNPRLKERGVFSVHGVPIKQSMEAFGQTDPARFLEVLANVPTRKEALDTYVAATENDIAIEARENAPIEQSRISKAYNNMSKNHIKEMKMLLEGNWDAVKKGIKRIALPLPRIHELSNKASEYVRNTRIRDLNTNQWKVAERRSQRKAVDAILKNEVEVAFREKQNAALSSQLAKQTHLAIAKTNRAIKFIARLQTPRMQGILKQAGPEYVNAIKDILSLYNFGAQGTKIDGYRKFAEKMVAEGKGDYQIPPEVMEWLTTQRSAKDLTVDQVQYLTNKMSDIVHQAKLKNRLIGKNGKSVEDAHLEVIAEDSVENLKQHPDYNPERIEEPDDLIPAIAHYTKGFISTMKNIQFIVQKLDRYVIGDYWSKIIYQRLDGTGYHEGRSGRFYVGKLQGGLRGRWLKHVEAYGTKEFGNLGIERVKIPEFKSSIGLKKGRLTKIDLMVLLTHMGNAENINRVGNFGVSADTVMKVLKRELKKKDFDFIQEAIWNEHERNFPDIQKVHKETTGRDLEPTQKLPFEAFGKTYDGGYMPLKYQKNNTAEAIIAQHQADYEKADPTVKHTYIPHPALEGIVYSPQTKTRTGSDWQINLDASTIGRGFDEVFHDIAMRVPVRDSMAILQNPDIAANMIAVIGQTDYNTLVSYIAEQTNIPLGPSSFRAVEKLISQGVNHIQGSMVIAALAGNIKSIGMSTLTVPQIVARMGGRNSAKYMSKAVFQMANIFTKSGSKKLFNLALEIDPTLGRWREGIDEYNGTSITNDIPKKRWVKSKTSHWLLTKRDQGVDIALNNILGGIDYLIKSSSAVAAYNQFMGGDAPGFDFDTVQKMPPAERHQAAKGYAAQFNASVTMVAQKLDKAPIQKSLLGKLITPFWNEPRNVLNNVFGDFNRMRYSSKKMIEKAREGDYTAANEYFGDMSSIALRRYAASLVSLSIISLILGSKPGKDDEEEVLNDEGKIDPVSYLWENATSLHGVGNVLSDMFSANIPVVNAALFASKQNSAGNLSILGFQGVQSLVDVPYNVGPAYLRNIEEGLTLVEAAQELSDKELRSIFNATSIAVKGFPASALIQFKQYLDEMDAEGKPTVLDTGAGMMGATIAHLKSFIKKNDHQETEQEEFERLQNEGTSVQTVVNEAKVALDKLSPKSAPKPLDDYDYEIIKYAESNGRKNARNSESSAYGYYQFVEGTWKSILTKLGGYKAGLTDDGRFSSKQQEKAMRLLTKDNARQLRDAGVTTNLETLYVAHFGGAQDAIKVYTKPDKTKLNQIFSATEIRANKRLLGAGKTVGELKKAIKIKLQNAEEAYRRSL